MFLLDTSFIIQMFRHPDRVRKYIPEINKDGVAASAVSYYEIFRRKTKMNRKELAVITRFFRSYGALPFDRDAAEKAAEVYERLAKAGEKINELDIMILGIMLANGIDKIITRDKDFERAAKYLNIEAIIIK